MSKIDIATSQDLKQINDLISAHNSERPIYFEPANFEMYDFGQTEKRIIFVARGEDSIIGYLSLHCENSFQNDLDIAGFEILVHPHYRRNGEFQSGETGSAGIKSTATDLVNKAINYLEKNTKINRLELLVKKENVRAKKLFVRLGFCVSELCRGYTMNINH